MLFENNNFANQPLEYDLMKKLIVPIVIICFLLSLSVACKKDDTNGQPYIIVNPPNPQNWSKDLPYIDLGAVAFNVSDSGDTTDITDRIQATNNVDVATVGTYNVWYNVSNESGATAEEKIRTVNIVIGK